MMTKSQTKRKHAPRIARATRELLCLLASYDAYGSGADWPDCLRRLGAWRAAR